MSCEVGLMGKARKSVTFLHYYNITLFSWILFLINIFLEIHLFYNERNVIFSGFALKMILQSQSWPSYPYLVLTRFSDGKQSWYKIGDV